MHGISLSVHVKGGEEHAMVVLAVLAVAVECVSFGGIVKWRVLASNCIQEPQQLNTRPETLWPRRLRPLI